MSDRNSNNQNELSRLGLAEKYREKLTAEFIGFHRRRVLVRKVAWVGCTFSLVGLVLGGLLYLNWNQNLNSPTTAEGKMPPHSNRLVAAEVDSTANPSRIDPKNFKAFKLELISDVELEEALRESESGWYLVKVDGQTRAFQLSKNAP